MEKNGKGKEEVKEAQTISECEIVYTRFHNIHKRTWNDNPFG